MTHKAECEQCEDVWEPTLFHLTVIPHEADRAVNDVRDVRTSYCPTCEFDKIWSDLTELDTWIWSGGCPGPLLWGKV